MNNTYDILHFFGIVMALIYTVYFFAIFRPAYDIIKLQNDNSWFSIGSTVVVMVISSVLMAFNG